MLTNFRSMSTTYASMIRYAAETEFLFLTRDNFCVPLDKKEEEKPKLGTGITAGFHRVRYDILDITESL